MSKKLLIGCGALIAVFVCIAALVVLSLSFPAPTGRPASSDATASPIPPAPSFEEIRARHKDEEMTDSLWKEYRTEIEGTQAIAWQGQVHDVTDNYRTVQVNMDPDSFLDTYGITFSVSEDVGRGLKKGQEITFSGQIEDAYDFLGSLQVNLKHAEIH